LKGASGWNATVAALPDVIPVTAISRNRRKPPAAGISIAATL